MTGHAKIAAVTEAIIENSSPKKITVKMVVKMAIKNKTIVNTIFLQSGFKNCFTVFQSIINLSLLRTKIYLTSTLSLPSQLSDFLKLFNSKNPYLFQS